MPRYYNPTDDEFDDDEYGSGAAASNDDSGEPIEQAPHQQLPQVAGFKRSTRIDDAEQRANDANRKLADYQTQASAELKQVEKPSLGRRLLGMAAGAGYGFAHASGNRTSHQPEDSSVYQAIDQNITRPKYYDKLSDVQRETANLNRNAKLAQGELGSIYKTEEAQSKIAAQNAAQQSYEARQKGWEARAAKDSRLATQKSQDVEPMPQQLWQLQGWWDRNASKIKALRPDATYEDYERKAIELNTAAHPGPAAKQAPEPKWERGLDEQAGTAYYSRVNPQTGEVEVKDIPRSTHRYGQRSSGGGGKANVSTQDKHEVMQWAGKVDEQLSSGATDLNDAIAKAGVPAAYRAGVKNYVNTGKVVAGKADKASGNSGDPFAAIAAKLGGKKPAATPAATPGVEKWDFVNGKLQKIGPK
jgi:hypothetical protein